MSLLKTTLETSGVAIPFKVRLEPYLVESICELSRLVRDKGNQHNDLSGLLFGRAEAGIRTAEALKTFADAGTHSELARRERWEKAYKSTLEESKIDPELSALDVVGWFSFRTGSGLLSSDVIFHNQHFRKSEDLALIIWREGPSQITTEVYSRSDKDVLTSEDYRWGSVRLSADIRHMREPVELAMRMKLSDDSFLRPYDSEEKPSPLEALRRKAEGASEKLMGFLHRRKEDYGNRPGGSMGMPISEQLGLDSGRGGPNPQPHSDRYTEAAVGRTRPSTAEAAVNATASAAAAASGAAAKAPAPREPAPPAWAGATGSALGTAPARSSEARWDLRPPEPRTPATIPPTGPPLDFSSIGRAPRTGRTEQREVTGLPMVLRPQVVKKSFPWPWAAGLFVVCSGLVFAFLAMGGLQTDGGRIGQVFQTIFPGSELNLKVRNEDDRLRLSWNQRNRTVASASDATLQIFDGQQHRDIHLDGRQVADGSVLYRPLTSDVTFRLEVRGDQGATSGSVRVLDGLGGRQSVLDVSGPTTPTQPAVSDSALQAENLSAVPGPVKDAGAPRLIRQAPASKTSQTSEATLIPPAVAPAPGTQGTNYVPRTQKAPAARYETPLNVGTFGTAGNGTTINGWDTSATRSRGKQRGATTAGSLSAAQPRVSAPQSAFPTAGYVPPRPRIQVTPNGRAIPPGTLTARTRVEVQVDVDQAGKVSEAHLVSTGVNEKISAAALSAAKQWTFDPASNNGQHVVSEHTIVFEFRPEQH